MENIGGEHCSVSILVDVRSFKTYNRLVYFVTAVDLEPFLQSRMRLISVTPVVVGFK